MLGSHETEPILDAVFFRTEAGHEPAQEWLKSDRKAIGEAGPISLAFFQMNKYSGSSFDNFLEEEGILEEVSARAQKRLLALQIDDIMRATNISKSRIAKKMHTDITQLNHLLDPDNTSVTLEALDRLARAVGKQLRIELA